MTLLKTLTAAALIAALAACADNMAKDEMAADATMTWTPVASKDAYVAAVAGKAQVSDVATFYVNADGTMTGMIGDDEATGTWEWKDGKSCSDVSWADQNIANCNTPEQSGDKMRYVRPDGSLSPIYTIQE